MRIAATADLHFSPQSYAKLKDQFERVRDEADVLVVAGDLTNYGQPNEMEPLLNVLVRLRLPTVVVLGNHDYESGLEEELCRMMVNGGIKVLDGTAYERDGIGFAGTKGFVGGFGRGMLTAFGERQIKDFVRASIDEALKLERAMSQLRATKRVVLVHYSPIAETVQGARVIALATLGLRNMYSKREIKKMEDVKGLKVRVQATPTEDTMFPAYGAQTVHMPFGSVYTSLQTGVMDFGENAVNVYLINKHYEVAPVLSMTEHEANNAIVWISDKLWQSLSAEQKQWVMTAARDVSLQAPKRVFELERAAAVKLEKVGVKIVTDVDKAGFQKIADPYLDKLTKDLGPHADKIKTLIRAID